MGGCTSCKCAFGTEPHERLPGTWCLSCEDTSKRELADARADRVKLAEENLRQGARVLGAEQQRDRLQFALEEYGLHTDHCVEAAAGDPCICGFTQALAGGEPKYTDANPAPDSQGENP